MQSCDCTVAQKFSEIAQDFGFWTKKCTIYHWLTFFGSFFKLFCWFLANFVCTKLSNRNIGRAKKFAFRKSVAVLPTNNYLSDYLTISRKRVELKVTFKMHLLECSYWISSCLKMVLLTQRFKFGSLVGVFLKLLKILPAVKEVLFVALEAIHSNYLSTKPASKQNLSKFILYILFNI